MVGACDVSASLLISYCARCAMRNVATMQNMTNDMNMHGGYEGHNLLELNYVSVPYSHRAGRYVAAPPK
jgi:hypothetical protein